MNRLVIVISGLSAGVILLGHLLWIRRHHRPCPWWLRCLLENRYMESLAGASTLIERMRLQPGMSVLDVGCGPGRLTVPFGKHVGPQGQVIALDAQERMLGYVRERMIRAQLANIQLVQGRAGEGEISWIYAFDRAVLVTVLGEIANRERALSELFQALKPGGLLSITEVLPDPDYQRASVIIRLCTQAGFELESRHGNFLTFTLNFAKPNVRDSSAASRTDSTVKFRSNLHEKK